jgi:hypothetical protein
MKNPVTSLGIDSGTVRLVAQRLDHHATPGPPFSSSNCLKMARFSKTCVLYDFLWKLVSSKETVIETLKIYNGHVNCRFLSNFNKN